MIVPELQIRFEFTVIQPADSVLRFQSADKFSRLLIEEHQLMLSRFPPDFLQSGFRLPSVH